MSNRNRKRYSDALTNRRFNFSVDTVVVRSDCLPIPTIALLSVEIMVGGTVMDSIICRTLRTTQASPAVSNSVGQYLVSAEIKHRDKENWLYSRPWRVLEMLIAFAPWALGPSL
jgi:hypothetical protein